jgi:hypothetical protein
MANHRIWFIRVAIAGIISFLAGWFALLISNGPVPVALGMIPVIILVCGYLAAGNIGIENKARASNRGKGIAWSASLAVLALVLSAGFSSMVSFTNIIYLAGVLVCLAVVLMSTVWLWRISKQNI